ncbi:MAG: hypothetical protein DI603_11430 [Roseateles depolymerans]|uniref:Oligosaccharide repeat unit polymerase n=1 Tax=Roseateles depolymerans TaxID=76731 RepID=A0A2W5DJN9_9BURK|nr:MAG: hypothetical protein DI603_11430 [Roseateles depolymerans]
MAPPHAGRTLIRLDLLALVALLLLLVLLACYEPSPWLTAGSTLTWAVLVARLLKLRTTALMMLSPFVLIQLSVMVSLIAIESGAHMKELGITGAPSVAGTLFPLVSLLYIAAAVLAQDFWGARRAGDPVAPAALPRWLALAGLALGLGADLFLLAKGLAGGFPLLSGTDRFQFRAGTDVLTLNLLNLKVVIAAALATGAQAAGSERGRRGHHALFGGYLLLSFLFGDKFFNIIVAALVYTMPVVAADPERFRRHLARRLPLALALLLPVAAATLVTYSNQGELSLAETLERLGDRVAGQGQLWWVAVRDNGHWFAWDSEAVRANLGSLVASPAASYVFEHRLVAFYFVERYAPAAMHLSFLHNNGTVTPTMLFEAYSLVVLGGLGLIVTTTLAGLFTGSVLHWLRTRMQRGQVVNVLLPAYVLIQTFYLMAQATLYTVLNPSAAKAYLAFLALQGLVAGWLHLNARPRPALAHG